MDPLRGKSSYRPSVFWNPFRLYWVHIQISRDLEHGRYRRRRETKKKEVYHLLEAEIPIRLPLIHEV